MTVQAGDGFRVSVRGDAGAITPRTKLIAIANPNSPTGTVASAAADCCRLPQRAPQAVVLVDEAYFHFFGETVMDLVGQVPNLVVARTFSKAYGLAGLRLGVLAGPASMHALGAARDLALQRELSSRWHVCRRRWKTMRIWIGMWRR